MPQEVSSVDFLPEDVAIDKVVPSVVTFSLADVGMLALPIHGETCVVGSSSIFVTVGLDWDNHFQMNYVLATVSTLTFKYTGLRGKVCGWYETMFAGCCC